MKRALVVGLALAAAGSALAAEPPVTRREFSLIMADLEGALNRGLKLNLPIRKASSDKSPMPRSEIIAEMDKLFEAVRPKFTMTPRPSRYDEEMIKRHNKGAAVDQLIKLCRFGAVMPAGPAVVGPEAGLTPMQLGDTLGVFVLQISNLTHQPSPLWSPGLSKG